jgi:rod shape-determining protein MreB
MLGKTPGSIKAVRPMKDGVIADFEITEQMIRYFVQKVRKKMQLMRPRLVVAVPIDVTEVESKAVEDSARNAGCRDVILIPEPMAAAMGVGMPVSEPTGNMIVDIGGGTSEIAVISLCDIVEAKSVRVGGDSLDNAIINHIKRAYSLSIGERTAETIKIDIGSAYPMDDEVTMDIRGRDLNGGLPKTVTITSEEIRDAIIEPVTTIVEGVRYCLEQCPPELAADLIDHGIVLAGGGAKLRGLDQLIAEETGLPVTVADDALLAVAKGTGVYLEGLEEFRKDLK